MTITLFVLLLVVILKTRRELRKFRAENGLILYRLTVIQNMIEDMNRVSSRKEAA